MEEKNINIKIYNQTNINIGEENDIYEENEGGYVEESKSFRFEEDSEESYFYK